MSRQGRWGEVKKVQDQFPHGKTAKESEQREEWRDRKIKGVWGKKMKGCGGVSKRETEQWVGVCERDIQVDE